MDRRNSRTKQDRREIHSVCVPVPTIVLNAEDRNEQLPLSHSRSAGDLDMAIADSGDLKSSVKSNGISQLTNSTHDGLQENDIELYCSPRMTRRSVNSEMSGLSRQNPGAFLDSLNACNLNCLDPGSRVGSSVSLNSEYTARSIGLISNDSCSENSHNLYQHGIMDSSFQKHSVLKRFYSTPEKDDDLVAHGNTVRRNSKSLGNMQGRTEDNYVCFDSESDSVDDSILPIDKTEHNNTHCDIDDSLAQRTSTGTNETPNEASLVTAVTGDSSLREGRIRKWLTEISGPTDQPDNS